MWRFKYTHLILFLFINLPINNLFCMQEATGGSMATVYYTAIPPSSYPTPAYYIPVVVTPILVDLHECAARGDVATIALAAQQEADLDLQRPSDGWTLAHIAAATNNIELISLLLATDADFSIPDKSGNNPLHIAFLYNNLEVASCLVNYQTTRYQEDNPASVFLDFFTKNVTRQTPLDCAYQLRNLCAKQFPARLSAIDRSLVAWVSFSPGIYTEFRQDNYARRLFKINIDGGKSTWVFSCRAQQYGIVCSYSTKKAWQSFSSPYREYRAHAAPLELISAITCMESLMIKIKALKKSLGEEMPEGEGAGEITEDPTETDSAADEEVATITANAKVLEPIG